MPRDRAHDCRRYTEWRVIWPGGSILECDRGEALARRWGRRTALERDPTPRRDPYGARRLTGAVQHRRVVVGEWR
jgi:hypothetical protein